MLRDYFWLEPVRRNFHVSNARLRLWRRRGTYDYRTTRIFKLLKQIESAREAESLNAIGDVRNNFWLLPFRADLRYIFWGLHQHHPSGDADDIQFYLAYCPPEMIPVCIWMLSKCADRFRLYGITEFCRDPSPRVRKHVAKALRRLEAWTLLDEMATLHPEDAKVQWFAQARTTHRPFAERLRSYTASVDDSHVDEVATPSRMPFWARDDSWDYTPPKSVLLIRRMLRRIRHWVRWGLS